MSQQRKLTRISSQSDIESLVEGINSGKISLSYHDTGDKSKRVSGRGSKKPGAESRNDLSHIFGFNHKVDIGKHSFHSHPGKLGHIIIEDRENGTQVEVPMKDIASLIASKGSIALQRGGLEVIGKSLKIKR